MSKIKKVLFIGSKSLGLRCLKEMHNLDAGSVAGVLSIDDRDDIRSVFDDFKRFTSDNNLDLHIASDKTSAEKAIRDLSPEICFVAGWYWIIGRETLNSVPGGFLGIHNSLLPAYRGGSPLVWAMINGERTVGTSLFSFAEGMDDGPIWAQEKVEVGENDYISDALSKLEEKAVAMLKDNYAAILEEKIKPRPQDHSKATFCAQRMPEDGLIKWEKSSREIYNFIKAQSEPYPGAFTILDNKKLTIWKARPENTIYYGLPGQVAGRSGDDVCVICGDNKPIILQTVGYEGVKSPAGSIIKSIKTRLKNS